MTRLRSPLARASLAPELDDARLLGLGQLVLHQPLERRLDGHRVAELRRILRPPLHDRVAQILEAVANAIATLVADGVPTCISSSIALIEQVDGK